MILPAPMKTTGKVSPLSGVILSILTSREGSMLGLLEPGASIVPRRDGRRGASFLLGLLLFDIVMMVVPDLQLCLGGMYTELQSDYSTSRSSDLLLHNTTRCLLQRWMSRVACIRCFLGKTLRFLLSSSYALSKGFQFGL
jgi:hypothetical protein